MTRTDRAHSHPLTVPDGIIRRTVLSPQLSVITIRCDDLHQLRPFITCVLSDGIECLAIADNSCEAAALQCHEAFVMRNKQTKEESPR